MKGLKGHCQTLAKECLSTQTSEAYVIGRCYSVYLLLILMFLGLGGSRSLYAQQHIYWIGETHSTKADAIFRYALDTGVVDTVAQASELYLGNPNNLPNFTSLAVDTLHEHIYWFASHWADTSTGQTYVGAIMHASLNGDNPDVFLTPAVCTGAIPTELQIDAEEEIVYWSALAFGCSSDTDLYYRNLEDQGPAWSSLTTDTDDSGILSFVVDTGNDMIYWTETQATIQFTQQYFDGITRAPLSNTVAEEHLIQDSVCDLALADGLSKIYWSPCYGGAIRRANLDGTGVEHVIASSAPQKYLAIDNEGQKIYWTESQNGTIKRANLDGTGVEDVVSGLAGPSHIALVFGNQPGEGSTSTEEAEKFSGPAELRHIYPNPVRDRATVEFILREPAHVILEIYDVLGRKVDELASGNYMPGQFSKEWNPTGQPNGVYFFRMVSDKRSETVPFILQR